MKNDIFLADMQKTVWAMDKKHLEAFCTQLAEISISSDLFDDTKTFTITDDDRIVAKTKEEPAALYAVDRGTAVIPIVGVLMKEVPLFYRYLKVFGIHFTSYTDIRSALSKALADRKVDNIMLHIDSPGGMVAGNQEAGDAIYEARQTKDVVAYIEDLGASGAFELASQAQRIYGNQNSLVGSIGVYTVYLDWSKAAEKDGVTVHVIRSGEHKGMGEPGAPITDEQIGSVQNYVDGIADNFIEAVARGRGMDREKVEAVATGETWIARTAVDKGLLDGIMSLDRALADGFNSDFFVKGDIDMSGNENMEQQEKTADLDAVRKEAAEKAASDEKARVKAIREQFEDDPEFALKAIDEGWDLLTARAEYGDLVSKRGKEKDAKIEELEAKAAEAEEDEDTEGNDGLDFEENGDDNQTSGDFLAMAHELVDEGKCTTMKEAMKRVKAENPGLHEKWLASQDKVKVEKEGRRISH